MMAARKPIFLYENIILDNTVLSATDTDSDPQYDVDNILDWRPYTRWKAASSGTKYISFDLASEVACDTIAIVGHNLATVGATVKVQEYEGTWVDRTVGLTATSDEQIIYGELSPAGFDNSFRVELDGTTAPAEIGVMIVGVRREVERYLTGGWDPHQQRSEATGMQSKSGELLGAVFNYAEMTLTAEWRYLTDNYIRNTFMPMWEEHISKLKPFIFSWRPEGTWQNDTVYARVPNNAALSVPYDPLRRSLRLQMIGLRRLP